MPKHTSEIIFNNLFKFNSFKCNAVINKKDIAPNSNALYTLKVSSDLSNPLTFAYAPSEGLNLTSNGGGVIQKNILGKLLAIPDDDFDKLRVFFSEFGFFLPISYTEYETLDLETLTDFVNRIKSTIRLMNSILKKDYKNILIHLLYLLYSKSKRIDLSTGSLQTCPHLFNELLNSNYTFPDLHNNPEAVTLGTYTVFDTFHGKENKLKVDLIEGIASNEPTELIGSQEPCFKRLVALYCMYKKEDETRYLIDFLFNIQFNYSIFKEIAFKSFSTYDNSKIEKVFFDVKFQKGLLNSGKIVVANEINHNIQSIHPKYDGVSMDSVWEIDSLISAIYFSIFYMKANTKIYKECENPNCKYDKYFLVNSTRANKKYCCDKCRNTSAQHRYRQKHT